MKKFFFWLMPLVYIVAGIYHFINPAFYDALMPGWLPSHLALIYCSGVIEILLGAMLIPVFTRRFSAWMIIAMLIVFFFLIHIPMVIVFNQTGNPHLWIAIVRLPLQVFLIWWAKKFTVKQR